jgi:hypothetical protein
MFFENNLITLRSRASSDVHNENTLYVFSNQLCTSINFRNKTHVALAEIHLPLNFTKAQSVINEVFILSDIVDDSIVGSERLSMLRILTIEKTIIETAAQCKTFQNLFWYPMTRNSVNNIKINIVSSTGDALTVHGPPPKEEETFVVLKFK